MSCRDLPARLALQFQQLSGHVHESRDPQAGIDRLVRLAVEVVPRCDWAGIVQLSGRRTAGSIANSAPAALLADELQVTAGAGPAIDAARLGTVMAMTDIAGDYRWPQIGPALAEQTPVRSVLSVRIADEPGCAALSFYGRDAAPVSAEALEAAALFATHARTFLIHLDDVRKAVNLADALTTSRTIGSAVGIIMLANRVTSDEAFAALRDASQRLHVKVRVLAEDVVRTGALPSLPRRMTAVPDPRPVAAVG